jgi:VanZ family protein
LHRRSFRPAHEEHEEVVARTTASARPVTAWRTDSRVALLARLGYVGILVLATLTPFRFQLDLAAAAGRLAHALHPNYTPAEAVDAVRNIVLFAGWGALWAVTAPLGTLRATLVPPVLTGLALSASIEGIQSLMPLRTSSVLDLTTNTAGALVGAAAVVGTVALLRARRGAKSYVGIPTMLFLTGYLTAVLFEAVFAPFRLEPIAGIYGGPFTRFQATIATFTWHSLFTIPVGDLVFFLPAGVFAVATLVELGWPYASAARLTVAAGALLWALSELAHGTLAIPIQVGAVVVHTAAVAAGAWLAVRYLPPLTRKLRGRWRPLYLTVAYSALLLLWAWRPFRLETDLAVIRAQLSPDRLIPLAGSAVSNTLFSVADLAEGFFLYLPLGGLLAVWPARRQGFLGGCWAGIYLAAVAELGQILVAGRFFDVTDFLVQAAGVAIGWAVVRHAGFAPYGTMLATGTTR